MAAASLLIAWTRSLTAYLFLILYIGLVGPPALLVAALTGRPGHLFVLGHFAARTARRLLGVRFVVVGLDGIDGARPAVYCINHRSNIDVVVFEILAARCPRLRAVYKAEINRLPVLGRVLRIAGFVPVQRADRERAIEAVDTAAERLAAGDSFLLAPEGTRSAAEEMRPFKKGAFVMAIKAQVPVVPIAIVGSAQAMPKGRFYVTPTRVTVRIGAPIPTAGLTLDDRDALARRVRAAMEEGLARGDAMP